jgi:peptidoglycan/xylan/chitin deacetylase (PgdA/CDA1 family)
MDSTKVIVNFDDFSEDYVTHTTFQALWDLKEIYPDFKCTMFVIPERSANYWADRINRTYPWIELAIHGSSHVNKDEWLGKNTARALDKVRKYYKRGYFVKGFKAPWWRISEEIYNALREYGFWVATNQDNKFVKPLDTLNYTYDLGKTIYADACYLHDGFYRWHGHIQNGYNGLETRLNIMEKMWNRNSKFYFISEIV